MNDDDVIRVEEEFDVMDADGSGEIDMDDLKLWMEKEGAMKRDKMRVRPDADKDLDV